MSTILQAGKDSVGTAQMKRSLLIKAGQALAPDAFMLVLDSESANSGLSVCFVLSSLIFSILP